MPLTETYIKSLKPRAGVYAVSDFEGLSLEVHFLRDLDPGGTGIAFTGKPKRSR